MRSTNNLGCSIDLSNDLTKIAVIDNNSCITYERLHNLSNAVAAALVDEKIKQGDRVAIEIDNGIDIIIAQLGVLKLGATAVLINTRAPKVQRDYMIESSCAVRVIKNLDWLDRSAICDFVALTCELNQQALIIYTAGSTSVPKGVIISHSYKQGVLTKIKQIDSSKRTLTASPLAQASGLFQVYFSLLNHSTLVLQKKFKAREFIQWIHNYNINNIMASPAVLSLILRETDLINTTDLLKIKHIGFASAPVSKKLYLAIKEKFPQAVVTNNYGSTEVGPGLFDRPCNLTIPELSVGYPYPHISYRLNHGVLEIKNPHMMAGYDNIKAINITKDGYFITNDVFEVDKQGFYYFVGRADDMFTSGGNNIYPRQVELILEAHPAVILAAVVGIEDDIKGHNPYAFVVTNSIVGESELKTFMLENLPATHCPKKIWNIDTMPMNPATNKINKNFLIEKAKQNLV